MSKKHEFPYVLRPALIPLFLLMAAGCSPSPLPAITIIVTPASVTTEVGQTRQLSVQFDNGSDTANFASANTNFATVDAGGLITGVNEGSTTITVRGQSSGAQAAVAVTVTSSSDSTEVGQTPKVSEFKPKIDLEALRNMPKIDLEALRNIPKIDLEALRNMPKIDVKIPPPSPN